MKENEEKDIGELAGSLQGYKEKAPPTQKGVLVWEKDLIFTANVRGYQYEYDARAFDGCFPTDTLLMSVAACLSIDVVSFLKKMKATITSYRLDISGERNPTPPQYYKTMDLIIQITGEGITSKKLDRAISLSQEKYCSVYHSLRKDLKVSVKYVIG